MGKKTGKAVMRSPLEVGSPRESTDNTTLYNIEINRHVKRESERLVTKIESEG